MGILTQIHQLHNKVKHWIMKYWNSTLLLALSISSLSQSFAFLPRTNHVAHVNIVTSHAMCPGNKNSDDDPTKVWYAGIADGIQNILTNSPLNEGKKALVRSLAGEYDREAIRAKLDDYI